MYSFNMIWGLYSVYRIMCWFYTKIAWDIFFLEFDEEHFMFYEKNCSAKIFFFRDLADF